MLTATLRSLRRSITYSRHHFQDLAIDRQAIKRALQEEDKRKAELAHFNIPANDKNQANFVKVCIVLLFQVRMNHPLLAVNPVKHFTKDKCEIIEAIPKKIFPDVTISAVRKHIITSIKKAKLAMHPIKKMHIFDAIHVNPTLTDRLFRNRIKKTFYNLIDHAIKKKMDPIRLYVHGCLIGKTQRYINRRYQAKGRGFPEKRDFCQVKVILYQKPEKEFFEEMGAGELASGAAWKIRELLLKQNADYKTIANFTGVTTAKGRQQAKLILKRRVQKQFMENQQSGLYVPKRKMMRQLREEEAIKAQQKYEQLKKDQVTKLKLREALYKKNMGIQS